MRDEKNDPGHSQGKDFLEIIDRGKLFLEEIMRENERLRLRNAQLEDSPGSSGDEDEKDRTIEKLAKKLVVLEERIKGLEARHSQIQKENNDFASRYIEIEEQNNNLANLYVASYQLHSTLDFPEVIQIVMEIIINLVGAEDFSIFLVNEKDSMLCPVAAEGRDLASIIPVPFNEGVIGAVFTKSENYYRDDFAARGSLDDPLAVIPLKIKAKVIGIIVIVKLFTQKTGFNAVDHELFTLLAGHAATAIFSSQLYHQSERKLSTLKNFLDLLKTNSAAKG
jgi:hypothetical protein